MSLLIRNIDRNSRILLAKCSRNFNGSITCFSQKVESEIVDDEGKKSEWKKVSFI